MTLGSLLDYRQRNPITPREVTVFTVTRSKSRYFNNFQRSYCLVRWPTLRTCHPAWPFYMGDSLVSILFTYPPEWKGNNHLNSVLLQNGPKNSRFLGPILLLELSKTHVRLTHGWHTCLLYDLSLVGGIKMGMWSLIISRRLTNEEKESRNPLSVGPFAKTLSSLFQVQNRTCDRSYAPSV
jgi:hypothetical protein